MSVEAGPARAANLAAFFGEKRGVRFNHIATACISKGRIEVSMAKMGVSLGADGVAGSHSLLVTPPHEKHCRLRLLQMGHHSYSRKERTTKIAFTIWRKAPTLLMSFSKGIGIGLYSCREVQTPSLKRSI